MAALGTDEASFGTRVEIGGLPIALSCAQPAYIAMIERRYANFVGSPGPAMARIGVTTISSKRAATKARLEMLLEDDELRTRHQRCCDLYREHIAALKQPLRV